MKKKVLLGAVVVYSIAVVFYLGHMLVQKNAARAESYKSHATAEAASATPAFRAESAIICKDVYEAKGRVLKDIYNGVTRNQYIFIDEAGEGNKLASELDPLDASCPWSMRSLAQDELLYDTYNYWCCRVEINGHYYTCLIPAVIDEERAAEVRSAAAKRKQVVKLLNLDGKSDYAKAKAIYRWIIKNVDFKFIRRRNTSSDALLDGQSACNGYAMLFMKMCYDAGVQASFVHSKDHCWNVVNISGKWYYADACWDDDEGKWKYFLKGKKDFQHHEKAKPVKGIKIEPAASKSKKGD